MIQRTQPISFRGISPLPPRLLDSRIAPASIAKQRFQELYCDASAGSNLNSGHTEGSATYTTTNGNWNNSTGVFIPTDGTNPYQSGVAVGLYAHVYIDGATTPAGVGRVLSVQDAVNGQIVISLTLKIGSFPSTNATARTLRFGGAWKGPNGSDVWPFSTVNGPGGLTNVNAGDPPVRVNYKNTANYTLSTSVSSAGATTYMQGYSSIVGDGGKAIFDCGGTTNFGTLNHHGVDCIFQNGGGGNNMMNLTGNCNYVRCVWRNCTRTLITSSNGVFFECEFYAANTGNIAGLSVLDMTNVVLINCYIHDCPLAVNGVSATTGLTCINCIFDTIRGNAITTNGGSGAVNYYIVGNTFYNIWGSGYVQTAIQGYNFLYLLNNNFVNIDGYGIDLAVGSTTPCIGVAYNNGFFGCRTGNYTRMGNVMIDGTRYFTSQPFNSPTTGDFRISSAEAMNAGRQQFTQLGLSKSGSIGYPDIGAVQHLDLQAFGASTGVQTLPTGYLNYFYGWKWYFGASVTVTVQSGSLPPGLSLSAISPFAVQIIGTPTSIGTYDFTLRVTSGGTSVDTPFEITIADDPNEGTAFVGGF